MAVSTLAALKLRLGIPTAETSEDAALDALLIQGQALIEKSLGFLIEQATVTEFHPGTGREYLSLRRVPVTFVQPTAVLTASSTTVTGLSSTSRLVAGMPVVCPDVVPDGTTLVSVNTGASTAVLSAAALATGTARLSCGCAVWLDEGAEAGQGPDDFDEDSALVPGEGFSLRPTSGPAGLYASGLLRRVGGYWPRYPRRQTGWLHSAIMGPLSADAIVKCVYTAGWAAPDIPTDLVLALLDTCALAYRAGPLGTIASSTSFDGYSVSISDGRLLDAFLGFMSSPGAAALSKYRRLAV